MRDVIQRCASVDDPLDRFRLILSRITGNVLEIGGGVGVSTVEFLKRAKQINKTVYVVDPFEDGWDSMPESYGKPYRHEDFLRNVADYARYLQVIKKSSQDCGNEIAALPDIGFVFVDGLQFKDAVLNDLKNAEATGARVICVDDVDRLTGESEVPLALKEFKTSYQYIDIGKREGYFIK